MIQQGITTLAADQSQQTKEAGIPISLAYAPTPESNLYVETQVVAGTSLLQALQHVGWLEEYPELQQWCEAYKNNAQIENKDWRVGVYSQKKPLSYVLQAHDRVEVYRPLTIDPMRKRHKRATKQ